jgi:ribosomal protein L31E
MLRALRFQIKRNSPTRRAEKAQTEIAPQIRRIKKAGKMALAPNISDCPRSKLALKQIFY